MTGDTCVKAVKPCIDFGSDNSDCSFKRVSLERIINDIVQALKYKFRGSISSSRKQNQFARFRSVGFSREETHISVSFRCIAILCSALYLRENWIWVNLSRQFI